MKAPTINLIQSTKSSYIRINSSGYSADFLPAAKPAGLWVLGILVVVVATLVLLDTIENQLLYLQSND